MENSGRPVTVAGQAVPIADKQPVDDSVQSLWSRLLARKYQARYNRLEQLEDLDKAIDAWSRAVALTPLDLTSLPTWLGELGSLFRTRFDRLGELSDLNKAVDRWSQAASLTPDGHSSRPAILIALASSLDRRFKQLDEITDLDRIIECESQAISLTPQGHSCIPAMHYNLSISLKTRFQRLDELADLDKAIEHKAQAVLLTPREHPDKLSWLADLGNTLETRFQRIGNPSDLEKAIEHQREAVSLTPPGHPDMPSRLNGLANSLCSRFEQLGQLKDLDEAIEHQSRAVSITPQVHPYMPSWLNNLATSFGSRFECLGKPEDLAKAIEHQSHAISLAPEGESDMPAQLSNLGSLLCSRYEQLSELTDLDKAIEHQSKAVLIAPKGHPYVPDLLDNLGISLETRFQRLDELADLDLAIEHKSQALSLTPSGHSNVPFRLTNLGISLGSRFRRLRGIADLNSAIDHQSQAILLTPQGHPDMPSWLSNLGNSLSSRFEQLGELADLNEAIDSKTKAVSLTPEGHSHMPSWLTNLAVSLETRFHRLGNIEDLDNAIHYKRQAVLLTPPGHSDMPSWLSNLGSAHNLRSHLPGKAADIQLALESFQNAAESVAGNPSHKFEAALMWARMCVKHRPASVLQAYGQAMSLLPQLVWLGSVVNSRYRHITDVGGIATEASAAAISMKDYCLALEWLEEGRSIVWNQMLQLRTPMNELATASPKLFSQLQEVARKLENASSPTLMQRPTLTNTLSLEQASQEHRRLAEKWEELLKEARGLRGFEHFLRPRKAIDLMKAAQSSAVVVINVHQTRNDALIIQPGHKEISTIPLALSYDQVSGCRVQLEGFVRSRAPVSRYPVFPEPAPDDTLKETLAALWLGIVKPVLEFLGYMTMSAGNLPLITWCTTGPLSFLPLHAAGDYECNSQVFDYVISSYTPTLSALLSPPSSPATFSGLLAVGQTSSSGMPSLPGTDTELNCIQERTQGQKFTRLDGDLATPESVLTGMEEHSWVHLACHAMQNSKNPMQSAFYLHGGTLSLAAITHKQFKHADLAFLSACQTATGDKNLSDESVHLAAGMLMAGYRGVIATMWSIGDKDAPLIAKKVYEYLLEGGTPDARRAALALHKATQTLREIVGMEAFTKWVPYIHIGL